LAVAGDCGIPTGGLIEGMLDDRVAYVAKQRQFCGIKGYPLKAGHQTLSTT
jgi:hypothetical protein